MGIFGSLGRYTTAFVSMATLFVVTITSVQQAHSKVRISERTKYYNVSGSNGKQLFRSIVTKGPKTRQVGHAIATTRTAIKVRNVKFKKQGNRCVVGSADVILDLVYTYPRWNGSRRASAKLRSAWEKFNAQVVRHEQTHGRISREYARRLHSKLLTLSGRISNKCQDFGRRSQRALKLLLNGSRKRHISFDRREGRARSRVRRLQKALISTR